MKVPLLMLEDLNHFDDPGVARALGRVLEALRWRDGAALVTCYLKPSVKAATTAGVDLGGTVECTYFTEEEIHALVSLYGGDAAQWGRLAFAAGAGGHPQLTHAFVVGMSARGWPRSEMTEIISRGITTADIDAERETVRRSLIASLPENARNLLYRLSLTIGRFGRTVALVVGSVPPSISQAGESIDLLVDPWIEAIGPERYRLSPLASGAGRTQLLPDEQIAIHEAIAIQMLTGRNIDARDADAILMHALLGKSAFCLAKMAFGVLSAPANTLPLLAENLTFFQLFNTNASIFPDAPSVGVMLRLAQFKLNAATGERKKATEVAAALLRELSAVEDGALKQMSEAVALGSVLATMGTADYLDNWVGLLQRYKGLVESNAFLTQLHANFEERSERTGAGIYQYLFAIGARISSVARLEHVIDELERLDSGERSDWLRPVDATVSDYGILINALGQRSNIGQISMLRTLVQAIAEWPTKPRIGTSQN